MKAKLMSALLAVVILTAACAAQPCTAAKRDASVRIPAGHYSLLYRPTETAATTLIPVTGVKLFDFSNLSADSDELMRIRMRFGRSLFLRSGDDARHPLLEQ